MFSFCLPFFILLLVDRQVLPPSNMETFWDYLPDQVFVGGGCASSPVHTKAISSGSALDIGT